MLKEEPHLKKKNHKLELVIKKKEVTSKLITIGKVKDGLQAMQEMSQIFFLQSLLFIGHLYPLKAKKISFAQFPIFGNGKCLKMGKIRCVCWT